MRYYTFNEFDGKEGREVTLSESEIIEQYWPYWYEQMCKKFGQEYVDFNYSKEECIEDFCIIHWAWESTP